MVIASHDRYLVERVCDTVYALYGDGQLTHLPGGVEEYVTNASSAAVAPDVLAASAPTPKPAADQRSAKKELARLERQIGRLEQREAELHEQLVSNATDYEKVSALDSELRNVQAERERTETQWLELADQLG
jgi:ABC transport system ATP-binding/permease protein